MEQNDVALNSQYIPANTLSEESDERCAIQSHMYLDSLVGWGMQGDEFSQIVPSEHSMSVDRDMWSFGVSKFYYY